MARSRRRRSRRAGSSVDVPVSGKIASAILGVRPEDCAVVAPDKGHIKAEIYAVELIGDHTLVTVKTGADMLTVKAPKDFDGSIGEKVGISLSKDRLFVFDASTGARVR
jgi:multiple sugar transport system ATP-binding protein